jgi:hypothetical protein
VNKEDPSCQDLMAESGDRGSLVEAGAKNE